MKKGNIVERMRTRQTYRLKRKKEKGKKEKRTKRGKLRRRDTKKRRQRGGNYEDATTEMVEGFPILSKKETLVAVPGKPMMTVEEMLQLREQEDRNGPRTTI